MEKYYVILQRTAFIGVRAVIGMIAVNQAPVVQRLDNVIHQINRYAIDKPLDSDLSGG